MRGKGICYDTGMLPAGIDTRPDFDRVAVRREMQVIAGDLRCTAVRITGGRPERLSVAAQAAADAGLEVWFSPVPCELSLEQMGEFFADCADRAEHVRTTAGANVVLVTGCEITLFDDGFIPGTTSYERIANVSNPTPQMYAAYAELPAKFNGFLAQTAESVRARFGGPVTYASGEWEPVNWELFDIVAVDAYRDASNGARYRESLRAHLARGKPFAVTEFGCCPYRGAADKGGLGWAIVEPDADPPRLNGDYERDEAEQVRYLRELHQIFTEEGVDLAFWFTFAVYVLPRNEDPRLDVDLASYGVVSMLPGYGNGYEGLGWQRRPVFSALAELK